VKLFLAVVYEFLFTGFFAVGGGLATIPFWQDLSRRRPNWFTQESLATGIAVAQSLPGANGTNMAAYLAYGIGGLSAVAGGLVGLMTPTITVDLLVSALLKKFSNAKWLERLMVLLRPIAAGLICAAVIGLLQLTLTKGSFAGLRSLGGYLQWKAVILYICLLVPGFLLQKRKIHPVLFLLVGGAAGMLFGM
jgi:chromate transporter